MRAILVVLFMGLSFGNSFADPPHSLSQGVTRENTEIEVSPTGDETENANDSKDRPADITSQTGSGTIAPPNNDADNNASAEGGDEQSAAQEEDRVDEPRQEWWWWWETPAQGVMAWASIVAAVFSVVAAGLLLWTLRETRRIGQAQVRAYLDCRDGTYGCESRKMTITLSIRNYGQSPATASAFTGWIEIEGCKISQDKTGFSLGVPVSPPETTLTVVWDADDFSGIANHISTDFTVCGVLEWVDVFMKKNTHRITFINTEDHRSTEGHRLGVIGGMNVFQHEQA